MVIPGLKSEIRKVVISGLRSKIRNLRVQVWEPLGPGYCNSGLRVEPLGFLGFADEGRGQGLFAACAEKCCSITLSHKTDIG